MKSRKRKLNRSLGGNILITVCLLLLGSFMALPLVYAVISSLKPLDELWMFPPKFFVRHPTLKNFSDLFALMSAMTVPASRYVFNTLLITVIGTGGHLILSSRCAFGLSKYRFKGRNFIFNLIVISLMFSSEVTAVPNFLILKKLGLVDTYWALILPATAAPLGLYLMKQFMETMIPDALLEAARIDGAGEGRIFWRIAMPMLKPAWLTLIIFSFQSLWNIGATRLIQTEQYKTLNYALSQIVAGGISRNGAASAATVVMMAVPIIVFLFSQKQIVETVATSGMKD